MGVGLWMFSQKKWHLRFSENLTKEYHSFFIYPSTHPWHENIIWVPSRHCEGPREVKSSDSLSDNSVGNIDIHTEKCVNTCFEKIIQAQRERSLWVEVIQKIRGDGAWHLQKGQYLNKWKRGYSRENNMSKGLEVGAQTECLKNS